MGCLSGKPIVDGIATDLAGRVDVVRVDLRSEAGAALAARYGVTLVPTFVVLTADGREVSRWQGMPSRARLLASLAAAGVATDRPDRPSMDARSDGYPVDR